MASSDPSSLSRPTLPAAASGGATRHHHHHHRLRLHPHPRRRPRRIISETTEADEADADGAALPPPTMRHFSSSSSRRRTRPSTASTRVISAAQLLLLVAVAVQVVGFGGCCCAEATDDHTRGASSYTERREAAISRARQLLDEDGGHNKADVDLVTFHVRDVILGDSASIPGDPPGRDHDHVRFYRRYRGLRVIGGDAVTHVDVPPTTDGGVEAEASSHHGLSQTLSRLGLIIKDVEPRVSASEARDAAVRRHFVDGAGGERTGARDGDGPPSSSRNEQREEEEEPELVVYARRRRRRTRNGDGKVELVSEREPLLAWDVTLRGTASDGTPVKLHVPVDASTGKVIEGEAWSDTKTLVAIDTDNLREVGYAPPALSVEERYKAAQLEAREEGEDDQKGAKNGSRLLRLRTSTNEMKKKKTKTKKEDCGDGVRCSAADRTRRQRRRRLDTSARACDKPVPSLGIGKSHYSGVVPARVEECTWPVEFYLADPTRGGQYTTDMANSVDFRYEGEVFTDEQNAWGDHLPGETQTYAMDAHHAQEVSWDYLQNELGRDGIFNDGRGSYSRVHFGSYYENAFWDPDMKCMAYGDGDGFETFRGLVSLDVGGHEMSHGVTTSTADLIYEGESGGLNEATSDIFAVAIEHYADSPFDPPDYVIAEMVTLFEPYYLRSLIEPSIDKVSADCWYDGINDIDVHYSSGPANHFFYLLAEGTQDGIPSRTCEERDTLKATGKSTVPSSGAGGIGVMAAARIWYRALSIYMTSDTDYHDAAADTLNAAIDLHGWPSNEAVAVVECWRAINVWVDMPEFPPTPTPDGGESAEAPTMSPTLSPVGRPGLPTVGGWTRPPT